MDSPKAHDEARKQWAIDQSGPLSIYYLPQLIGYFKSDAILNSKEFGELDTNTQNALRAKTKPSYEIFSVSMTCFNLPLAHSSCAIIAPEKHSTKRIYVLSFKYYTDATHP